MDAQVLERRHFRRMDIDVSVKIGRLDAAADATIEPIVAPAKNISLAGVYCYLKAPSDLAVGDAVMCSINVPPAEAKIFPFARLHSKGWVTRVDQILTGRRAGEIASGEQLVGIAIAFASDATALATFE